MWIKNTGKVIYDPYRKDLRKLHKSRYLIVEPKLDDISKYYKWFLQKEFGSYYEIQNLVWKPHISVVEPKDKIYNVHLWKKYQNEIIEYEYSVELKKHWKFWYLDVKSNKLMQIRKELGLNPDHPFHITIGREFDWQQNLKSF